MKVNEIIASEVTIILTNDDGIEAPGLTALERTCGELGTIFTVAPDRCHSSLSHRVTTAGPITLTELEPGRFQLDGTPADCARIAITCLQPGADWLISGINRGGNLGVDTYLSGTVAAAREAAVLGVKAIAISQYVAAGKDVNWELARQRALAALDLIFQEPQTAGTWWNVNLPHTPDRHPCEIAFCPVDSSPLDVRYQRSGPEFRYCGSYHGRPRIPGSDVDRCFGGSITVSRIDLRAGV